MYNRDMGILPRVLLGAIVNHVFIHFMPYVIGWIGYVSQGGNGI
jgi:hypothetical protein